jgi:hypothetical protein
MQSQSKSRSFPGTVKSKSSIEEPICWTPAEIHEDLCHDACQPDPSSWQRELQFLVSRNISAEKLNGPLMTQTATLRDLRDNRHGIDHVTENFWVWNQAMPSRPGSLPGKPSLLVRIRRAAVPSSMFRRSAT